MDKNKKKYENKSTKDKPIKNKPIKNKLISKIEETYNEKEKIINKLLNKNKEIEIKFIKSGTKKMVGVFDTNGKLLLKCEYNFYGIYQPKTNLWVWSTSIPGVSSKIISNINKIKAMNYLFESNDSDLINLYYQLLTQDVLLISEENVKELNKLFMYLSDDIYIVNPVYDNNIQYIGLKKIKENYI